MYILEAGCGEGYIAEYIAKYNKTASIEAFDISSKIIEQARKRCPESHFFVHNIYDNLGSKRYDLIVCCEVLEHMEYPKKAVKNLMNNGSKFIFSVPHEPIWSFMNLARGKYIKDFGNTPGHIQRFTKRSFSKMLEECNLKVIKYHSPLPWLMIYCEKES